MPLRAPLVLASTLALATPLAVTVAVATPAHAVPGGKTGDFDGDGHPDVAIGAPTATVGGHSSVGFVRVKYTHASPSAQRIDGTESGERFGTALATGDFDNDGFADLAVGSPRFPDLTPDGDLPPGAVSVYIGSNTGLHFDSRIVGPSGFDTDGDLGHALAVGDIDGDGFSDLAIGDPGYGDAASGTGGVIVRYGSASGLGSAGAQSFFPLVEGAAFGAALAIADVDGDGHADLVVGIPTEGGAGRVKVMFGTGTHIGTRHDGVKAGKVHAAGLFGAAIAARDVDHNGRADIAVGAPAARVNGKADAGKVVVLFGHRTGITHGDAQRISLATPGVPGDPTRHAAFGSAVGLAKVLGHRHADLVVGAPGTRVHGHRHAGAVFLLEGHGNGVSTANTEKWTLNSRGVPLRAHAGDRLGKALFLVDRNGDGHADLFAGAPGKSVSGTPGVGAAIRLGGTAHGFTANNAAFYAFSFGADAAFGSAIA